MFSVFVSLVPFYLHAAAPALCQSWQSQLKWSRLIERCQPITALRYASLAVVNQSGSSSRQQTGAVSSWLTGEHFIQNITQSLKQSYFLDTVKTKQPHWLLPALVQQHNNHLNHCAFFFFFLIPVCRRQTHKVRKRLYVTLSKMFSLHKSYRRRLATAFDWFIMLIDTISGRKVAWSHFCCYVLTCILRFFLLVSRLRNVAAVIQKWDALIPENERELQAD